METTEKTTSRVDSAGDVLSGKLKDLFPKRKMWSFRLKAIAL